MKNKTKKAEKLVKQLNKLFKKSKKLGIGIGAYSGGFSCEPEAYIIKLCNDKPYIKM